MPITLTGTGQPVQTLTLDTPRTRNALGRAEIAEALDALQACEADRGAAVLVVRGTGPGFSSGADLAFIDEIRAAEPADRPELLGLMGSLVHRLVALSVPTVAAVQGAAVGGGACLALACDDVVLADDARLGLVFTALGLPGGDALAPWLVARRAGTRTAWRLLAHGQVLGAADALSLGLADEVVAAEDLDAAAARRAQVYAAGPRQALRATKRQLLRLEGVHGWLEPLVAAEQADMVEAFGGPELAEGLAASRDRRPPVWR